MSARKPGWLTPEIRARMGVESDATISRDVDISSSSVARTRRKLGIHHGRSKRLPDWCAPGILKRLNSESAASLAVEAGVSRDSVLNLRVRLNVKCGRIPKKEPAWLTPEVVSWMGKLPDSEVARNLKGVCPDKVRWHRIRLGIKVSQRGRGWVTPEVLGSLGKVPDREIALTTGVTAKTVGRYRRFIGIPDFTSTLPPAPSYLKNIRRAHRRDAKRLDAACVTFLNPSEK